MPSFRSLFRGRRKGQSPQTEQASSVVETATREVPEPYGVDEPVPASEAPDESARAEHAMQADVPLRGLNAYRHDPAYNNFLRRMKRAPGVPERRPRTVGEIMDEQNRDR